MQAKRVVGRASNVMSRWVACWHLNCSLIGKNMHVLSLPILWVLTTETLFWYAGLQLQRCFYFFYSFVYSCIACINNYFLCTLGLVMDVQSLGCPEYENFKVVAFNCPCRAVNRKHVIKDQAWACQTKACCACCANYNIYMYVFLIDLPVQNT